MKFLYIVFYIPDFQIYEAMDCNLLPVLQSDVAKEVADKLNKTCERLEHISSNRITEVCFLSFPFLTFESLEKPCRR